LKTDIALPKYLQEDPLVDIFPAYPQEPVNGETAKIDLINDWPQPSSKSPLDDSQMSALQQILTKRLAIIQGPPGTGKTHVSVIALRILLNSWKFGNPPIVVAAQTNHALDQLLLHVSQFEGNFIRLGGQTADTNVIKKRTLYEVRRASPNNRDPPGCLRGTAFNKLRKLTKWFADIFMSFQDHKAPLSADLFLDLGLLDATQYKNLVEGATQFVQLGGDQEKSSPIALWLGDALEPFFVKYENESSFGFDEEEEEDLEFEQLKELEAEQGLTDDEDHDILKGQYIPVIEPFIAHGPRVSPAMIEMYSKYADLWMVPAQARGRIYRHLQGKAKQRLLGEIRAKAREYAAATRELKIGTSAFSAVKFC
jgi:helicase required for RNAi-mediated heterochromatin assembly 1